MSELTPNPEPIGIRSPDGHVGDHDTHTFFTNEKPPQVGPLNQAEHEALNQQTLVDHNYPHDSRDWMIPRPDSNAD